MKHYYLVNKNYDEENQAIFSYEEKIGKGEVVVIPQGVCVAIAVVAKELDTYTAMSNTRTNIKPIICVLDLREFNKRNQDAMKAMQIEQIMEERMDEIKRIEAYRRIADKSPEFKELFKEYENLKNPKKATEEDRRSDFDEE